MIRLRNVSKTFNDGEGFAVRDVSFDVDDGQMLVLLGSSGSGKTTSLKMINRLIEPTSGRIEVGGRDVLTQDAVALRRSIGYVFQGIGLFPHLTIEENVTVSLRLRGVSVAVRRKRAAELLELVGLDPSEFARRMPHELSGGQQQRVGVVRALAGKPQYLLMDEPFGALDAVTRELLQQELLRLKARLRKTTVFVTHDLFEALLLGDRIGVMHEGRLEQLGTPEEILRRPATPFVRELFEKPVRQAAVLREHLE